MSIPNCENPIVTFYLTVSGGIIPSGTINITENGEYDVTQYATAIVEAGAAPILQDKTITPTTSQQIITADEGYDGLGTVTINAVTSNIDNNIQPGNILEDVFILGVEGTVKSEETIFREVNLEEFGNNI